MSRRLSTARVRGAGASTGSAARVGLRSVFRMRALTVAAAVAALCLTTALAPTAAFAAPPAQASSAAQAVALSGTISDVEGALSTPTAADPLARSTGSDAAGAADSVATGASVEPVPSSDAGAGSDATNTGASTDPVTPAPGSSEPATDGDWGAGVPDASGGPALDAVAPDTVATDAAEPLDTPTGATADTPAPTPTADTLTTLAAITPTPLPASTWVAPASPVAGQVLAQTDPAAVDYGVDIAWAPPASVSPLGYRVELFSGRSVTNTNALIARIEVDATTTHYRVEGVGFGATTVTARVTLLDGASTLPNTLVSEPAALPSASAGALSAARAGVPTLSDPTADGFTATWDAADTTGGDPAPAGYALRVLERRHDQAATSANSFITTTLDVGGATTAVVTGLAGSSRYLAAVVAYDLVDGVKQFRPSSGTSPVPAWSVDYAAQTLGSRPPATEWSSAPAAPNADTARSLSWQGAATTGRYTGGSPVTGYRVQLFATGIGLVAATDIAVTDPSAAPAAQFGGLTSGASYSVRVAATNAAGVGELSDFSPVVTLPTGSAPGSRPPAYADRAALDAAVAAGTVVDASATAGGSTTVEQGQDATLTIPWTGAQSGEAWWYGDATFASTVSTGAASGSGTGSQVTVSTKGLAVGTYRLLLVSDSELDGDAVPAGAKASVVKVVIVAGASGTRILDDAVLRWGLNDEANNGAYFGGCNYLSAGRTPDPGSSMVFGPAQYSSASGDVTIEKPDASGRYVRASWDTKCLDRTGATLSSGTATPYGGNQFVMTGGTGEVDTATGTATIRWTGDVTVVYYGGLSFWYLSDPVLTVENGVGTLTATVGGFGADMDDATKWTPLADRSVTLAVFSGAQVGPDGFTVTPDYRGVAVTVPAGKTAQARTGADWGSFPQSFIDFHLESGQAAYWYSSGGQADAAKPAQPFTVGYDAATFAAPTAPEEFIEKAGARVPVGKLPPPRFPAAAVLNAVPASAGAVTTDAPATSLTIVESPVSAALGDDVVLLLVALIALLGLVVVIAGVGGGLVALGATSRR